MASPTHAVPFVPIKGKKQQRDKFLKLLVSNFVSPYLRKHIKYVPRTSHTNCLGNLEAFAASPPKGKRMELTVGDSSGEYALSEIAGRHWLELGISALAVKRTHWNRWAEAFGYELVVRGDLDDLLTKTTTPLVEVTFADKPWLVAVAGAKKIVSDVDVGPPSFADLDTKGVAAVARVAKSKVCECFCCTSMRKKL